MGRFDCIVKFMLCIMITQEVRHTMDLYTILLLIKDILSLVFISLF